MNAQSIKLVTWFKTIDALRAVLAVVLVIAAVAGSGCSSSIPGPRALPEIEMPKSTFSKGSLWPGENSKNSLFRDNKAARVGDIVTVQVVERNTAMQRANTNNNRNSANSIALSTGAGAGTNIALGGGNSFTGSGSNSRSDQLVTTVTAMVVETFPNGNMLIDGQKLININHENQVIRVRGVVRRDDITYNNAVLSTQLAEAEITYAGDGTLSNGTRAGWLGRGLTSIWPF